MKKVLGIVFDVSHKGFRLFKYQNLDAKAINSLVKEPNLNHLDWRRWPPAWRQRQSILTLIVSLIRLLHAGWRTESMTAQQINLSNSSLAHRLTAS